MDVKSSIMQIAGGAFRERVDYEMSRVIDNILDINTKATAKRKVTLTIELEPDDYRRIINVTVKTKATLAGNNPLATVLCVDNDYNGELVISEMTPQVPGQIAFDGTEQERPMVLRLVESER